ncbi:hypothetical protein ACJQ32_005268, partial [Escherichia coli]
MILVLSGWFLGWIWCVKRCRQGLLFIAPADAARHKRCLWSVS